MVGGPIFKRFAKVLTVRGESNPTVCEVWHLGSCMIFPTAGFCNVDMEESCTGYFTEKFQFIQKILMIEGSFPILVRSAQTSQTIASPHRPRGTHIESHIVDIELVLENERMPSEDGGLGVHNTVGRVKSKTGSHQSIVTIHGVNPFKKTLRCLRPMVVFSLGQK